jgi:hypothetical protein
MKESYEKGVAIHLGPEPCGVSRKAGHEALVGVRVGRAFSPEITQSGVPTPSGCAEGNTLPSKNASWMGPHGVVDPAHARKHLAREPGDPRSLRAAPPMQGRWSAAGSQETHAADARAWEVRQLRSTKEGPEQRPEAGSGGTGGKAAGQAEPATGHHVPDTGPGARACGAGAGTASS